jgi:hypothetical protein
MIDMGILVDEALSYDAARCHYSRSCSGMLLVHRNMGLELTAINFGPFKARRGAGREGGVDVRAFGR